MLNLSGFRRQRAFGEIKDDFGAGIGVPQGTHVVTRGGRSIMATVLITGANRGIGLALARQYAADAAEVICCCRDLATAGALKDLAGSSDGRVRILPLDVADEASIASLKDALSDQSIDILINNAGIVGPED